MTGIRLPEKKLFSYLKPQSTEKRKEELEGYLSSLTKNPTICSSDSFIQFVDEAMEQTSDENTMKLLKDSKKKMFMKIAASDQGHRTSLACFCGTVGAITNGICDNCGTEVMDIPCVLKKISELGNGSA
eukprot:TRINITY_DN8122_c0_g1_i1.p1 TRINITY_DN8122_c0_g1~~TRINITY_DN8122_c0_g1_i1.p1  ORF type:complete len:129 (-),score=33.07 TRINITY_DN8122_c0_g1_i1:29-415(-)